MRYYIMAAGQEGVFGLKRDTLDGARKKAGELRRENLYNEVRIIDTSTGEEIAALEAVSA